MEQPKEPKALRKGAKVLTDEQIKQLKSLSGLGLTVGEIATFFNLTTVSMERILSRDPRVRDAHQQGFAQASAKVRQTAYEMAISKKHPQITMFWLKTRAGWRETQRVEIFTPGVNSPDVQTMTKPEREALIEKLMRFRDPMPDEIED